MTKTEPSRPVGIAIAVFFLVVTVGLLGLAFLSSLWWLVPAFTAGLTGVIGLTTELTRPSGRRVHPVDEIPDGS